MKYILSFSLLFVSVLAFGQTVEPLPYGDMNRWVTRNIKESHIIGGNMRSCYAIGPTRTIDGDEPYTDYKGSPWASSNVMAKVVGITKVSNALFPDERKPGDKCARLSTIMEHCKAIGLINIDVVVAATMFLGKMFEPIKDTSDPYRKMEMGIPFTRRPVALVYDYRLTIPADGVRTYSSGFGRKKTYPGTDKAEVFILLQRRWEDSDGNIHARRVGTGRELFDKSTSGWVDGHRLVVNYGDISHKPYFKPYMDLIPAEKSYCALNSKGEIRRVVEEGWDSPDATPTHLLVMFSAGSGEPYVGTIGTNFYVDNIALEY